MKSAREVQRRSERVRIRQLPGKGQRFAAPRERLLRIAERPQHPAEYVQRARTGILDPKDRVFWDCRDEGDRLLQVRARFHWLAVFVEALTQHGVCPYESERMLPTFGKRHQLSG